MSAQKVMSASCRAPGRREIRGTPARFDLVTQTLESYARRGVFRGFSHETGSNKVIFRFLWHRDRLFELVFTPQKNTLRFTLLLPGVDAEMYRNLQSFIKERFDAERPDHRRIAPDKLQIRPARRKGNVTLTAQVLDGDDEYGTRKLIHLVHEIFLTFLLDGRYYDYLVENFDLDPDRL